jgi:hypothetical protein
MLCEGSGARDCAQAHAETDELFGEIWNSDDKEGRTQFFEEACARLDGADAGDRMHAVGEEMKPLAQAIVASPATSMEALRAKGAGHALGSSTRVCRLYPL